MTQVKIQTNFSSGEWAPSLNARVDLKNYKSGAALVRNFFIDYRGGASTRTGTKYILQAINSARPVRLIPFQASPDVGYILELGDETMRFYNNGAPVLEGGITITAATQANPCVISVANSYAVGDIIFISGADTMTQINNRYFRVNARTAGTVTLGDLNGVNINSTTYSAFTDTASSRRVYTIQTPWDASDIFELKFAQNVTTMVLCHENYIAQQLTLISATNWTLVQYQIGTTMAAPTGLTVVAAGPVNTAGQWNYLYSVTSVDTNGQESPAANAALANKSDIRDSATPGTITVSWTAVAGAASYNIYKAELRNSAAVPSGSSLGFVGNVTGTSFIDSNIGPDFSLSIPITYNPFLGASVASVTIVLPGTYTTFPLVSFSSPPSGITALGSAVLEANAVTSIPVGGSGYVVNDSITLNSGVLLRVTGVGGFGEVTTVSILNRSSITVAIPTNPLAQIATSGGGINATFNLNWRVKSITINNRGSGYSTPSTISFSTGGASATATLDTTSSGNPIVPSYFQQRLVFGGQSEAPANFYMTQPGSPNNFDYSNPIQPDDSISGQLIANQLQSIQSLVPVQTGLMAFTNSASWLLNGGSQGEAVSPINIVAHPQSYIGAAAINPIVVNFDVLFVQAKGSVVRDLAYNLVTNVFTGTDITVLSSHLFYGYTIVDWCWAEEPFKLVYAVRSDGELLMLVFMKEQEIIGWSHGDTSGRFKSVATVVEEVDGQKVDAVYTVVERTVNGFTVKYVERFHERTFAAGVVDAWVVDAGISYDGAPATTFEGAEHLAGRACTGLADGVVIPSFVMPTNGTFTLTSAASKVIVGLAFTKQFQTLQLDQGDDDPTIQGELKKISGVTVRVKDTLGLFIGTQLNNVVAMKDLVVGNVGSVTNEVVTDLVTGDAFTTIDPKWAAQGQYFITQPWPLPATILGVMPEFNIGGANAKPRSVR